MSQLLKQNERTALEYLSTAKDLSPVLRQEIESALNVYDVSLEMVRESHQTLAAITTKRNAAKNAAHKTVVRCLLENKIPNTEKLVTEIVELELKVTAAQIKTLTLTQSNQTLKSHATGFYTTALDELLRWVAVQRAKDLLGYGDVLPAAVLHVYNSLQFRWFPSWSDGLDLAPQEFNRLPLVWLAHWSDKHRASLAWVFNELATGNYKWVQVPKRKDPVMCVQLTNAIVTLPPVPRATAMQPVVVF
jgi:hypothetical protein